MVLQVIIPMAGIGSRFKDYGFKTNKYLLPINIEMNYMIEKAITSLNILIPCIYYFIINEENGVDEPLRNILDEICKKYNYSYHINSVTKLTEGPASTVYSIIDLLDKNEPLLVSNSDQVLDWNFNVFYNKSINYDGCVLTYKPNYLLTEGTTDKHSFIHLNENGEIDECREKIVLSNHALVGVHYFKNIKIFIKAYEYMVLNNIRAPNGEFYLSLVYQSMLENNYKIGYYKLEETESFYPVGEPNDYFQYLYQQGGYIHDIKKIDENKVIYKDEHFMVEYFLLNEDNTNDKNCLFVDKKMITDINVVNLSNYIKITIPGYIKQNRTWSIHDFTRGWFIGDFLPNIIKTNKYEIGLLTHKKNEKYHYHYHKKADEFNFLIEGKMKINEKLIEHNTIFIIPKNQIACSIIIEDCIILCIKIPSVPTDKYII
jgi:dTDP-glucose pyrophosphorylase/mannose-6-phosphate isomerase-like protein (cupin superfamily)